ncbi:vitamin H transporter, putative [Metarhizium acridum CQMa 102]|uniref:Vitamin H transporter, putative n=1 Tax=Metarhizium acridum (strain CQMa 102) TaxID=655827 RepID=E9DXA6_METAQ|nr:vitamin H transporter, putative [Metarhizium acridum CQMa 102]EFY91664.1 vitamin H transporter, putative [Metarhizium acridum CQMa 102]
MSKDLSSHNESLSDRETRPFVEDPALEKRLVAKFRTHAYDANVGRILRKVDMRLIPMLSVMVVHSELIAYVGVNKKEHLFGLRFCLGLLEAGYFPGVLLFMSNWYKKSELARRFSIFYCASLVSGAVGGLIAGLITDNMQNRDGLPAWKWLFLIEGCLTVGFATIAIFILPDFPATTRWLTAEEREYAISRLENDHNSTQAGNLSHLQSFLHAVRDWR